MEWDIPALFAIASLIVGAVVLLIRCNNNINNAERNKRDLTSSVWLAGTAIAVLITVGICRHHYHAKQYSNPHPLGSLVLTPVVEA